jgi:hypothetical protein
MPRPNPSPYGSRPVPAGRPSNMTWILAGVGAFVVLVVGVVVVLRVASKPRGTITGNVPVTYFKQASADFADASRLLAEGKLSESAEKFSEAQVYRSRAGERQISQTQTFEQWCAAKEREYRAAAAGIAPTLSDRVGKPGGPSLVQVDTFLERFGNDAARDAWRQRRPELERQVAAATAAGAYRIEWIIKDHEGTAIEDLYDGDKQLLAEAVARFIGAAAPLVPASATPGVAPEEGLGYVRVALVFAEAPYRVQRTGREVSVKVPAVLSTEVEVTTNKKPGRRDGLHRFIARVDPPSQLKENEISGTRGEFQRKLINKVVEQVSAKRPKAPGASPDPADPSSSLGPEAATNR